MTMGYGVVPTVTPSYNHPTMIPSNSGYGVWEWKSDSGWQTFDGQATAILEAAYATGQSYASLSHGFFGGANGPYTVDFTSMAQRSATGNVRVVRRR